MITPKALTTEEEYRLFVEQFTYLANEEFKQAERAAQANDDALVRQMLPKLVSIANTVGYLRGQDGAFIESRPHTSFQNELYENEDAFTARLEKLVKYILQTRSKDAYLSELVRYYQVGGFANLADEK